MHNLREFYKVDQLQTEIRDLKKENAELKKRMLKAAEAFDDSNFVKGSLHDKGMNLLTEGKE